MRRTISDRDRGRSRVGQLLTTGLVTAVCGLLLGVQLGAAQEAGPTPLPRRTAVLARADNPVDALAASSVAAQLGGVVFLTARDSLSPTVADALDQGQPDLVILAGGEAALAASVQQAVESLLPAADVRRVAGADRTATSVQLGALLDDLGIGQPVVTDAQVEGDAWLTGTLHASSLTVQDGAVVSGLNADRLDGVEGSGYVTQSELGAAMDHDHREVVERVAACAGTAFQPTTSESPWSVSVGVHSDDMAGLVTFRCPLQLPDGARMTGLRYSLLDNTTDGNVATLEVRRIESYGPGFPSVTSTELRAPAPVTTISGTPGFVTDEVTTATPVTVDNRNYGYYVGIGLNRGSDAANLVAIYHVGVTYEILDVPTAAP